MKLYELCDCMRSGKTFIERPPQHLCPLDLCCDAFTQREAQHLTAEAREFRPSRLAAVAARKQMRAITSAEGDEDWFDSMNVFESYLVSLHLLISKSIRVFIDLPDMKSQIGGVCGELIKKSDRVTLASLNEL